MASPTDPSHDDNWHGGYYELSIKLGAHDDARLDSALHALWAAGGLSEPFRDRARGPAAEAVQISASSLLAGHLRSVVSIPGLGPTLCAVIVVREETYESGVTRYGADWLDLCLPLGALGNLDERVGAYPFGQSTPSRAWREPVEQWFGGVGRAVFDVVRFDHAVTGFEVSGIEASEVEPGWVALLSPADGELSTDPVNH